jgi:hypothetical protein
VINKLINYKRNKAMIIKYSTHTFDGCNNQSVKESKTRAITQILSRLLTTDYHIGAEGDVIYKIDVDIKNARYVLEINNDGAYFTFGNKVKLTVINETPSTKYFIKEIKRLINVINRNTKRFYSVDMWNQIELTVIK